MGYQGDGTYVRLKNFSADSSAGIKILASGVDTEFNDFASAMTIPVLKDGQNEPTADLPMGGKKHVNVGAAASATDYLRVKEYIAEVPIFVTDNNSGGIDISVSVANTYTTVSAGANPADGSRIRARMSEHKGGSAPSLIITTRYGLLSKGIVDHQGKEAFPHASGGIYDFVWDNTRSNWQVMNPVPIAAPVGAPTAVLKAKNAAGTVAGVGTSLGTNARMVRNGDISMYSIGASAGVSCSISASEFLVSILPGMWRPTGTSFGTFVDIYDITNAAGPHPFQATLYAGGSVVFTPKEATLVTVSADTVWKVGPWLLTFIEPTS